MSLEHILLGYLREPSTGYDLGKEFAEGARHFWFAERSQIYPLLKRLERRGWLSCREEPSERGPRRKVYETTREGRAELRRWLLDGPHIGRERLAYVAQTFFLGELDSPEEALDVVRRMRSVWRLRLVEFEAVEEEILAQAGDEANLPFEDACYYAALRLGLSQISAKLAWCDETIERLERRCEGEAAVANPVEE